MSLQVPVNGCNGNGVTHDKETFLFTSESVGEGHPGKFLFCKPKFGTVNTTC